MLPLKANYGVPIMLQGKHLFAKPCEFIAGCAKMTDLPLLRLPEIAFAGRSNVGKSSLVNALTGRNTLAKTSATPGRTRELNFFLLANQLLMADLPGYGYAKAPKTEVARWTQLVREYLAGRSQLRRVLLLIDSRQGLMKSDIEIMGMLDSVAVTYQIIFTKTDKLKPGALTKLIIATQDVLKKHPAAHPEIIATSSHGKDGIDELRNAIAALLAE